MKEPKSTRDGGKIINSKDSVRLQLRILSNSVPACYLSDWKEKDNLWFQGYKREIPNLCLFH